MQVLKLNLSLKHNADHGRGLLLPERSEVLQKPGHPNGLRERQHNQQRLQDDLLHPFPVHGRCSQIYWYGLYCQF